MAYTQTNNRISGEERLDQIVAAAAEVIAERGYNGTSLQEVANRVGITQVGVLRYVKNKQGLLMTVIDRCYDQRLTDDYALAFAKGGEHEGEPAYIPRLCRTIVERSARDPQMTLLFHVLDAEAISETNPAHEYFKSRPARTVEGLEGINWQVPEGVDAAAHLRVALFTENGLEQRWLMHRDECDLLEMWQECENALFPLPTWEGCR